MDNNNLSKRHLAGLAALCVATLTGAKWQNPSIADPTQRERQLTIDDAYCNRVAVGAAPMPSVNMPQPQRQGAYISGSSTTYGPNGGAYRSTFSGTATPTQNVGEAFAGGFAQGAAVGALLATRRQQKTIHKGCMAELGWSKSAPSSQAVAQPQQTQAGVTRHTPPNQQTTWERVSTSSDGGQIFINPESVSKQGSDVTAWLKIQFPQALGPGPGAMVDEVQELTTFHCLSRQTSLIRLVPFYQGRPLFEDERSGPDVKRDSFSADSLYAPAYDALCRL
ncbi:MAG: hypothetical protein J0I01_08310 [Stenotrophomonas nitritireducens]|uniref:surface-adhesin E family protein n=1 Tax=Stenotrophomonas nitritireducens TaxID=83617 RepID=UPI001AC516AF|nr:surface-adhesin E family protein [Stenotrophomonas nitritireducens]MBN8769673.1 hypothetical protein [Stenotrophomonas sp.]MBN8792217.1 hypothetical protein [Stenotrophomonas nitritireducens]MBN8803095.1 hypothetical protein [Stenotrophomonas acidaminiphila]